MKLIAGGAIGVYGGIIRAPIYISADGGASWTLTSAPTNRWASIACSGDDVRLVAVAGANPGWNYPEIWGGDGLIYLSADSGGTWMPTTAPSNNWTSIASSADGAKLVALAAWEPSVTNAVRDSGGAICRSVDAGATWTRTSAPSNNWTSVAASADGARLVATAAPLDVWKPSVTNLVRVLEGAIYRSVDAGATWTRTSAPDTNWSCIASSADGTKLLAAVGGGYQPAGLVYISTNSGATWTATTAPSNDWRSVASSADGTTLAAGANRGWASSGNGLIHISADSGATWKATDAPRSSWGCLAFAADGHRLIAADGGGPTGVWGDWGSSLLCTYPYSGPWRWADAPRRNWSSVASSVDGTKLLAAAAESLVLDRSGTNWVHVDAAIYRSLDSGSTWTRTSAPSNNWSSVASSADGTKLVAVSSGHFDSNLRTWVNDGVIEVSSDAGTSWTRTSAPSNAWSSVASSADGTKLVAAVNRGSIFTSSNSGVAWTRSSAPNDWWSSVASSRDGTKLVAVERFNPWEGGEGLIYTSTNSGAAWTRTSAPTNYWSSVACSADGTKLVAVAARFWASDPSSANRVLVGGTIYRSLDSGATWKQATAPPNNWVSVSSCADGTRLVALGNLLGGVYHSVSSQNGQPCIYTSTDSGATWVRSDSPAVLDWSGVVSSADGSRIVAVGEEAIYVLQSPAPAPPLPPSPRLLVDRSGADLGLSWVVPSTRFVLQQSADLRSAKWVDVTTSPTLDFTRLHYRVPLTPSASSSFYRLKQQ